MKVGDAFSLTKQAAIAWMDDNAPTLGAALAYYTIFSLAPLLIISIGLAGMVLGQEAAQGQIFDQLRSLVGDEGGRAMQEMVRNAGSEKDTSVFATVLGGVTLLFGASTVFGQLQTSLNAVWGVQPKPGRGVRGIIEDRVLSFGLILAVGFLLLVSLVLTAVVAGVGKWMGGVLPGGEAMTQVLNFALSLAVITALFAMIFKMLPDAKIAWHDVWIGAFITALLFVIGKSVLGIYLGKSSVGSSFGAAGSLIVLVVWVYYSAQILFFGAEWTQVYANRFGSHVEPTKNAVAIDKEKAQSLPTPPA
ncbi:MAG: rane protein [Chthoniobacter sp.]|jgi:membrane protein|nr:rane protein [Chthoniobacter sp.]